jgi:DNA polymerase delta subunit 2
MTDTTTTTRAYTTTTPSWQRFHEFAAPLNSNSGTGSAATAASNQQHHPYARQYSHVYSARLAGLRERCLENAKLKLGVDSKDVEVVDRIIGVKEGKLSILVGTIVKEMDPKRRPNVAAAYSDKDTCSFLFPEGIMADASKSVEGAQESLRSYLFDSKKGDVLHLEDESGRVELCAYAASKDGMDIDNADALDANKVCTGVVAAVIGEVSADKGVMHVKSIHFAGGPTSDEEGKSSGEKRESLVDGEPNGDPVILLVSGISCGTDSPSDNQTGGSLALRREMLLEYLSNSKLGNGAAVSRVIVAGGGVAPKPNSPMDSNKENNKVNGTNGSKSKKANHETSPMALSLRELDLYFSEILSCGIPVDYIPGFHDPTNANWPQRPIHSCLLPNSCSFVDLFQRSTNPYESVIGGERVLGSDGLNVTDLRRYLTDSEEDGEEAKAVSSMEALRQTLKFGHIAPTGPDSLPMFPSSDSDPFILSKRPSVYFSGNAEKFETCMVASNGGDAKDNDGDLKGVRLVCVPSFALTGQAVMVNLNTLATEVVSFNDSGL